MAYDITQLTADLSGVLHGTTVNQVTGLFNLYNRAARQLLLDIDPQETKRIMTIEQVYNNVYDYGIPVDLKGNRVIDIYPQVNRHTYDVYTQTFNQDFDVSKGNVMKDEFTILFNSSLKTIRLNSPFLPPGFVLNDANGVTSNGTWTVGGGATNIQTDNVNYAVANGSVSFNLSAGQATGYVENTTMSTVNLSSIVNQGYIFLYVYLPTASAVTSISVQWGSDSSNYYSQTTSVTQQNTAFINGWNLLSFPWLNASVTGSPDASNITYSRVTFAYNSTLQTAVRINGLVARLGSIMNIEYYSKYMFRDAITGAYQETVTDNSNLINLDTESYNIFFNLVAFLTAQQTQGLDAMFYDGNFFGQEYLKGKARYQMNYRSEYQKPQQVYYTNSKQTPDLWFGTRIRNW